MTWQFALWTLALPFLGLWVPVRPLPWLSRVAVYFAAGLWTVVVEMWVVSVLGLRWNVWMLVVVPLAVGGWRLAVGGWGPLASRPAGPQASRLRGGGTPPGPAAGTAAVPLAAIAIAILTSAVLAGAATSGDFVYFWGTKGQKWGAERFLDTAFTLEPSHYMHPDYPPLVPLYYAWTMLNGNGAMDWWGAIVATPLFLTIGTLAMWGFGRYANVRPIAGITALFASIYALAYVRNQMAGNAEPALHMFECIALAALTCPRERSGEHDFVAAVALSGVALAKVEGSVFVLLVCGILWIARNGTLRERLISGAKMAVLPVATIAAWLLFGVARGLTDTYVPREDLSIRYIIPTAIELVKELSLHLGYTPWIALAIVIACGRVRNAVPYLAACVLFLLFLLSVYTRAEPHLEWSAGRTLMTPLMFVFFGAIAAHRPSAPAPHS